VGLCEINGGLSQFMIFIVIQTLAALSLLVFYLVGVRSILSLALIIKLAMFPFYFWFVNVGGVFSSFYLFLCSTIFKVPSVGLFGAFILRFNLAVFFVSILLTLLIGGILMIGSNSIRFLIVGSSVGNNSWFLLSQIVDFIVFLLFIIVYSFLLYFVFVTLSGGEIYYSYFKIRESGLLFTIMIIFLTGLPPFPVFFLKMIILLGVFSSMFRVYYLILILFFNVFIVLGYMKYLFNWGLGLNMNFLVFSI